MRRAWPLALLAFGPGAVLVLASRFPVALSGLWAVDAAVTQVIVLWPVMAGLAAADAVRLRRSGAVEVLRSAPPSARARLLLGRSVALAAWGCLGLLLSVAGAAALARVNGSPTPWAAWPEVVLALAGVVTAASVGTAFGSHPLIGARWILPPLVTAAGYAALALDLGGASRLVAFAGATDASVTAIVLRPAVLVGELALMVGASLTAVAVVVVTSGARRRGMVVAVVVLLALIPTGAWWRGQVDNGVHAWSDPRRWSCASVGSQAQACLPPDQARDLAELARSLRPVDARLRELEPGTGSVRYQPGAPGEPQPGVFAVRPPLDASGRPGQLTWDVVLASSGCADEGGRAWTDDDLAARVRAEVAVARWLTPDLDVSDLVDAWQEADGDQPWVTAPSITEARDAWRVLRSCRGAW